MTLEEYKQVNLRKASVLMLGGFKPSGSPQSTNFGLNPVCQPDEGWPHHNNTPLFYICQLNLTECPYVPDLLKDIRLLTLFITPGAGLGTDMIEEVDGRKWVLRTYDSLEGLVPLVVPQGCTFKRGFEGKWDLVDDFPVYDDPDIILPEGFKNSDAHLDNFHCTKIGGFASNIQSEQWWANGTHPANPKYCFQIDSEEKVNLAWGDSGTLYIARGTAPGAQDRWFLDLQFY